MKKRTLKRTVALLLITVMTMAMMGVSASAEENSPLSTAGKKVNIKQTISLDATENVPNATFTYSVTKITADAPEITDVSAVFEAAANSEAKDYTANATIDFSGVTFPGYGVYSYTIAQKTVEAGFVKDTDTLQLDVYVTNSGTEYNYVLKNGDVKVDGFENVYDTRNFVVKKTVTGNTAAMNDTFNFTIDIEAGAVQGYDILQTSVSGKTVALDAQGSGSVTVPLGHDGTFTIYGLAPGASINYTVKETGATGYKTFINGSTTEDEDKIITGTMTETGNVTVSYENNKAVTPGTGIIMTFAPYVLMLVAAAAIGFIFLRRRQHDC